jgi:hypothetical protein
MAFERQSKAKEAARHSGVFDSDDLIIGTAVRKPASIGR